MVMVIMIKQIINRSVEVFPVSGLLVVVIDFAVVVVGLIVDVVVILD